MIAQTDADLINEPNGLSFIKAITVKRNFLD